jgi:hypothetical protein
MSLSIVHTHPSCSRIHFSPVDLYSIYSNYRLGLHVQQKNVAAKLFGGSPALQRIAGVAAEDCQLHGILNLPVEK